MIFNIQRFSTHDGDGIRTMIFYKGCPLRCQWCSNPESQSFDADILFDSRICKNFGDCLTTYPAAISRINNKIHINRSVIQNPETLRETCLSRAITVTGENKSLRELLAEIEKDIPFYRQSNGGVALSGGEPLSQGPDFITLLQELKNRNIGVSIESSLHVPWEKIERCLGFNIDFLVDLKHTHKEKFRIFTQGNCDLVLENIKHLDERNEKIIIRIPVIPGFNHSMSEMKAIIDFAASLLHVREIHFIPYHALGKEKYTMLGKSYSFGGAKPVDVSELSKYTDYANDRGFKTSIGG